MRLETKGAADSSGSSQANLLNLSPNPPFFWLSCELTAAPPWLTSVTVTFTVTCISQGGHTAPHGSLLSCNVYLDSRAKVELPMLSPVAYSVLIAFFVSLFQALLMVLSKSPGVVLWLFPTWIKNPHYRSPRQTCSRPSSFQVKLMSAMALFSCFVRRWSVGLFCFSGSGAEIQRNSRCYL